jgi:hypothetical protein
MALIGVVSVISFYTLFQSFLKMQETGTQDELTDIIIPVVILILVILLFVMMKLNTRIDETGIYYQFFPFHLKLKKIGWNELEDIKVRKYSPIMEYGGWGIRGLSRKSGKGMAFNVSGTMGIQLVLKDGGRLLLGTKLPEKAQETINNYRHKLKV